VLDALHSENARSAAFLPANDDERGERGLDVPVEETGFAAPTPGSCSAPGCSGSTSGSAGSCTFASTRA